MGKVAKSCYAIFLILICWGRQAPAQTRVDLRTQAKSVDFSSAAATKPSKTGATLPPTCSVGETFFHTNAGAGENLYLCATENAWTQIKSGTGGGFTAEAGRIRLSSPDYMVSIGSDEAAAKLAVVGTSDQVQAVVRGSGSQTQDLYQLQRADGAVLAKVSADGFLTQGIGTSSGHGLRLGNAGDTGGSSITVHGGDGAYNSEPGWFSAYSSSAAPFRSFLFPCRAGGSWCASAELPSMDSDDHLLSSMNAALVQNKVFDRTNSVKEYLDWVEGATPADSPGAGTVRVYVKAGAGVCWMDSAGLESCASGGTGSSGSGLPDPGSPGLVVRTAPNATVARALSGMPGKIAVSDGDGQAGDPAITTGPDIADLTQPGVYQAGARQTFQRRRRRRASGWRAGRCRRRRKRATSPATRTTAIP